MLDNEQQNIGKNTDGGMWKPDYNFIKDEMEVLSGMSPEQILKIWEQSVMPPITPLTNFPISMGTPRDDNHFIEMEKLFYQPINPKEENDR